jgi:hypothetical protein
MNRMEIKMGCLPLRISIICRELDRCKIKNIHIIRNYDNSTRVLSSRSLYTGTSRGKPFNFCTTNLKIIILLIGFYIAKCCFIRDGTNRTSSVYIFFTEKDFRLIMRPWLIFTGKVKINIWHLIPFKAKERFEWNIMSVFTILLTTLRTIFIR